VRAVSSITSRANPLPGVHGRHASRYDPDEPPSFRTLHPGQAALISTRWRTEPPGPRPSRADHPVRHTGEAVAPAAACRPYRLGERSPRPSSSLSVTSRSACLWVNVRTVRCDWSMRGFGWPLPKVLVDPASGRGDNYCKPYRTHDTRHVRALPTPGRHVYSCSFDLPARGPYRCVWHPRTRV